MFVVLLRVGVVEAGLPLCPCRCLSLSHARTLSRTAGQAATTSKQTIGPQVSYAYGWQLARVAADPAGAAAEKSIQREFLFLFCVC